MERLSAYANYVLIVLSVSAVLLTGWWYFGSFITASIYLVLACFGVFVFGLLVYSFQWYYLALVGLIPLSVDAVLVGGAKLNLPSEALLLAGMVVWLYFNRSYLDGLRKVAGHPVTLAFWCLFGIELLSGLMSDHIDVSLKRLFIHLLFFFGFYVVFHAFQHKKDLKLPFLAYAVGLLPVMVFTLIAHVHFDFEPQVVFSICQPYYNDHTVYGACLAFLIPFLFIVVAAYRTMGLSAQQRFWLLVLTVIVVLSELLALSRAAILSLVVAGVFYLLLRYRISFRNLLFGLGAMLALVWVFSGSIYELVERNEAVSNDGEITNHFTSVTNVKNDASNLERINRWICAYRMFEERPVLGFGPGTYQFEYNRYQTFVNKTYISTNSGNRGNAHSEYLAFLSEAGILGFLSFLAVVLLSLYYGMQNHYRLQDGMLKRLNLAALLGLVTYYFHGIFNSFLDQNKLAFLFFGALGMIVWITNRLNDETAQTT